MDYRKDGNIFIKLDCNNEQVTYRELGTCESLYGNHLPSDNGENEENNLMICETSSSDESINNIFGDDWLGKPGVSSESDSEQFPSSPVRVKEKRKRNQPLPSHIELIQGENTKYKCNICVKVFNSKSHVRYHAYCGQIKPFKCHLCFKTFSKKTHLNYHIKTHTGQRPFTCLICDKSFIQLDKLKRHKRIHFGNNVECDICSQKFRDTYSLNQHKKTHNLTNLYTFKCKNCDKSFKNKSTLNKHNIGVHSSKKLFVCEHCGKDFAWKYNLICHIKSHSGLRAYSCEKCSRKFKNKNDLNKHHLTHVEEKDYECDVCGGTFKRRDNLIRHLRNIHPESETGAIVKMKNYGETSSSSAIGNRISVIKQAVGSPVQSSVIRHVSSHQPVISSHIRECVIKSTKQ